MSKGDRPRPYGVTFRTFDSNWDAIFGKKEIVKPDEFEDKVTRNNEETQEMLRNANKK